MTGVDVRTGETGLRERVESLVVLATGRAVSVDDLRGCAGSLDAAGVNSIAYINLIEALDRQFHVVVDPERDAEALSTVDGIVALIRSAGAGEDRA
ncbi:phosphopantetheine-binding protein [Micromonospora chaiyaphumensis]|uniref:Phosphopantetheine attachment site n=1 Tax=Micromonospora chaiyaphumensis TaxID=307119 RepID=A0A1C4VZN9_9ACTN|nr:phosphopantetheine-binding protein [Micromonospora chaiyaphumensis]SCE89427.1 Phosphopantetheine attachment site [Micromonospora chaiyaphumensis]